MDFTSLANTLVPSILTFLTGFLLHKRELKKIKLESETLYQKNLLQVNQLKEERDIANKKLEYLPRIMKLTNFVEIEKGIDEIFKKTKITRFLIFVGVNGKTSLNHISCIFYKYKNPEDDIQPIDVYKNVDITGDIFYKSMLHRIENTKNYLEPIDVLKMQKSILKEFYYEEQISHSRVGFMSRNSIDENNDFLIYYSAATDSDDQQGITEMEENKIKTIVNAKIKSSIQNIQTI